MAGKMRIMPERITLKRILSQYIKRIWRWINFNIRNETVANGGIALAIGLASGIGVWAFKYLIELANTFFFTDLGGWLNKWGGWTVILLPVLGGLIVGLLVQFGVGQERHHGVAGIMEAVALAGGRLRYKRMPIKAIASALSIGSGASVGPEDPSVQIGANIGSFFGSRLRFSEERVRTLVAAGSAAGIAAAFNAPIAGVFFAVEIILGELSGGAIGIVLIAAVVSAVFTQAVSGVQPAFVVPTYSLKSVWELPFYLVLGLLAGPVSALYIRLLYWTQDIFNKLNLPRWGKTTLAGLIVGLIGIFLPQIFGIGYKTIEQILAGAPFSIGFLIVVMIFKLIMTPVSIAGGFMGGVFAPALFIGATLGGAFGLLADQVFPSLPLAPHAFATVGMAAMLAGAVRAPFTAILLLFEMTNDYRIILPLMFSVAISLVTSQGLLKDSIYSLGLARKGIRLERGRDVDILESISVAEVMDTTFPSVLDRLTIQEAADALADSHHHGMPVVNSDHELVGILTLQDIDQAIASGNHPDNLVAEICTQDVKFTFPEESLGQAMRLMGTSGFGRLPVVERENPKHLLGVLRRSDLVRAYDIGLRKRTQVRHRKNIARLDAITDDSVRVHEIVVQQGAPCAGKTIREAGWPKSSIISSVRRGQKVLVPNGNTMIFAGDTLVIVVEPQEQAEIIRLCQPEQKV